MECRLRTGRYLEVSAGWPGTGRHVLAQYDDETIVVYQAYRPAIGRFAAEHGRFGGEFSLSRMSWIKTNFLWMMYRSGWGTKQDQEVTLAVRLPRAALDGLMREAVASTFEAGGHATREAWAGAVAGSEVRLQWDPDHDPVGRPLERRAVQLGLRGETLRRYAQEWPVEIEDVSAFVAEQRAAAMEGRWEELRVPEERVYPADRDAVV